MIVRHWHGAVPADRAEAYLGYLRRTGLADYAATPGNRGACVLRRDDGGLVHVDLLTLWASMEAIRAFAGDDVARARYYPEDAAYLVEQEPAVVHYAVADAAGAFAALVR